MRLHRSDDLGNYELVQEDAFSFPVSAKDYRLWKGALLPVYFILYDAQIEEAYWLDVQAFAAPQGSEAIGKSVRLHVPRRHVFGVRTIRLIRQWKEQRARELKTRLGRVT